MDTIDVDNDDDDRWFCSQGWINLFLDEFAGHCDYYSMGHSQCVRFTEENLSIQCGGRDRHYSCLETGMTSPWAGSATYYGMSST